MTGDQVIRLATRFTGVTVAELKGQNRVADVVRARFAVVRVMRRQLGLSAPVIGRLLGDRDHSTILHAEKRAAAMMTDTGFSALVGRLESAFSTEG